MTKKQNVTEVTPAKVYENVKVMEDCEGGDQIHEIKERIESGIYGTLPLQVKGSSDVVGNCQVENQPIQNEVFASQRTTETALVKEYVSAEQDGCSC